MNYQTSYKYNSVPDLSLPKLQLSHREPSSPFFHHSPSRKVHNMLQVNGASPFGRNSYPTSFQGPIQEPKLFSYSSTPMQTFGSPLLRPSKFPSGSPSNASSMSNNSYQNSIFTSYKARNQAPNPDFYGVSNGVTSPHNGAPSLRTINLPKLQSPAEKLNLPKIQYHNFPEDTDGEPNQEEDSSQRNEKESQYDSSIIEEASPKNYSKEMTPKRSILRLVKRPVSRYKAERIMTPVGGRNSNLRVISKKICGNNSTNTSVYTEVERSYEAPVAIRKPKKMVRFALEVDTGRAKTDRDDYYCY